jgi:hypothetical protein
VSTFLSQLASALGINVKHIRVTSIRPGSVIVDYEIVGESIPDLVKMIPQVVQSGGLNAFGPIIEYQVIVSPDMSSGSPSCPTNTEYNSAANTCNPCTELYDSVTKTCKYCSSPAYYDAVSSTCHSQLSLEIAESPLFWVNIGFALFTLFTFTLIATKLKTYCLLENSNKSQESKTKLQTFTLSLLNSQSILNVYLFTSAQTSKLQRLHYLLMKLVGYSLLSAVFVPTQIDEIKDPANSGWFDNIEAHIVFIPYYTIIIYTVVIYLAKAILRNGEKPTGRGNEISPLETFIKTLATLVILSGYVIVLVLMISDSKNKQDIWAANFVVCLIQEIVFLPWFTLGIQIFLINLMSGGYSFDSGFINNFFSDQIDSNTQELMASKAKPSSKYYARAADRSPNKSTEGQDLIKGHRSPDTVDPSNVDFSISNSPSGSPSKGTAAKK